MIHKKEMTLGMLLLISFFVVLFIMWTPIFGKNNQGEGLNAFEASDNLFNTISKGSSYFMEDLAGSIENYQGNTDLDLTLKIKNNEMTDVIATVIDKHVAEADVQGQDIHIRGSLTTVLDAAVQDSDDLYYNQASELAERYGYSADNVRQIGYAWYLCLKSLETALNDESRFKEGKLVADIINKGVEVGYNFYGIKPESAASKAGILTFSLVFYVGYTLWWGMAIFYLFEGFGLKMTKGKKKEV